MTQGEFKCFLSGAVGFVAGSVGYITLWAREPDSQYWGSVNQYREAWMPWYVLSYGFLIVGFFLALFSCGDSVRIGFSKLSKVPPRAWHSLGWMLTVIASVLIIAIAFHPRY